ncbi:cingulin isoform X2 [Drosophila mojavensis]|uniref:Uncharacterized protein, isoform B n=1 Tax=Drosophila mojavensis TaxID=7230 RepID=A0A0Q9WWB4_DROMO|nr:cingulin isoform X2 [Drosophila mojavensis]KRF93974.1 uncharacterized protein Dmoj_GI14995, isoform B [Drosophila mojavensis]KRF93975.1 uncharacterized protein Dmoj_GI14995, isoform C [Drosophila mojavensis]KRF93976.1 uncharacterized protein Dmoj_GI14995, isoform D [Drosophila mojavensis]
MSSVKASTKENLCKNSKTSSKTGKGKMNRPIVIKVNSPKSDPTSSANVLKCFVKHHKMSLEELRKKSNEISVKMEKTEIFIAERNQENAQLKRQLQDIREQLENVKAICDGLAKENCELKDKYMACHSKYIELEISYDREFSILNANMIKQKAELEQVDRLNEQLKSENFQQRQVVAQLQAVSAEKDNQLTELKLKADQLQAYNVELKELFEEYKENVSQKHERETAQLKEEVKEQAATIRELIENSEVRDVELQSALSNLKHAEEFGTELSNRNSQLSSEVSDIAHRLKVEIEDHNKKIRELNMQISELVSETKRYQFDIAKLVEANNSLKDMNNEANAALENEVAKANQESIDLKKKFEQLQQEHMDTTKTLLAEKADLAEKLQALKELHASNIIALEVEIQQKEELRLEFEQKVAELERQKNNTIAELTYKVNQIKNLSVLPVKSAMLTTNQTQPITNKNPQLNAIAVNSVGPTEISTDEATPARRRQIKRTHARCYNSDFNTETEDDADNDTGRNLTAPKMKKMSRSKASHKNKSANNLSAFDKLKNN